MPDRTYTTHDIAKFCDVYPSSVVHWINSGKLKSYCTPGGHHRVTRDNLISFLREFNIPLPPELGERRARVMVVDDDVELARVIEKAFLRHPAQFTVETCHSGIEALIRMGQTPPDLVVLDVVLPRMDGVQVCRVLKSQPATQSAKIIAVSGKKLPFSEQKLHDVKIDAFYRKPLDLVELIGKAAELLKLDLGEVAVKK